MTLEAQTLVGIIENIEIKDGKSDRGPWRLHKFRIRAPDGTKTYSTFDKGWPTTLVGGETYRFTFVPKQDGEFTNYNLTSATQVDPDQFGAQPASNGKAVEEWAPDETADEARARVRGMPQAELKSPSRSYDQNQDITRRSIERQIALKTAVDIFGTQGPNLSHGGQTPGEWGSEDILRTAAEFFAWLRETATDAPQSPAEPISNAEGRPAHQTGPTTVLSAGPGTGREYADRGDEPTESDGGPAFYPDEPVDKPVNPPKRRIATMKALLSALNDDFSLVKADLPEIERIIGQPLDEATDLQGVYDLIAHDRAEQAAPVADTEK